MIDPQLQELLVCPKCHGELDFGEHRTDAPSGILCTGCGARYPIVGQIPLMYATQSNDGFGHDLYHAQLHGNFFERVFHSNRIETLLRLITTEIGLAPGARMLDVGCNTGPMLIPLRQRGYDVVGIDISADDVQQAEQYLSARGLPADRLSVGDGTRLPFRDQSFDLVLLIDILEHTDYPEHIVSEARRLLVPGGIVIATVPWAYHPYVRYTWLRKLLSSRKTIDEHPDAPFEFQMLQSLFSTAFQPLCCRLVFHWVCVLGVYRLQADPAGQGQLESAETAAARQPSATPDANSHKEEPVPAC
jgi:SAM-dependent methyltransferase